MASGMVCLRSLPTARADWLLLIRNRTLVQFKLIKKLGSGSDVDALSALVHDTEPLGLSNPQLSF